MLISVNFFAKGEIKMIKSFSVSDEDIIHYLEKKENVSNYICSIIRQDMLTDERIKILSNKLLEALEDLKLLNSIKEVD